MQKQAGSAVVVAMVMLVASGVRVAAAEQGEGLLGSYESIHAALAGDRTDGVLEAAKSIAERAESAARSGPHAAAYLEVAKAAKVMNGADVKTLRQQYQALSMAMARLVEGDVLDGADIYYCSMVNAYWLQAKGDTAVKNPYYGSAMLGCGWIVAKVEA